MATRPVQEEQCDKCGLWTKQLERHKYAEHVRKYRGYVCETCSYTSLQATNLKNHVKHTGHNTSLDAQVVPGHVRYMQCGFGCGYTTIWDDALMVHRSQCDGTVVAAMPQYLHRTGHAQQLVRAPRPIAPTPSRPVAPATSRPIAPTPSRPMAPATPRPTAPTPSRPVAPSTNRRALLPTPVTTKSSSVAPTASGNHTTSESVLAALPTPVVATTTPSRPAIASYASVVTQKHELSPEAVATYNHMVNINKKSKCADMGTTDVRLKDPTIRLDRVVRIEKTGVDESLKSDSACAPSNSRPVWVEGHVGGSCNVPELLVRMDNLRVGRYRCTPIDDDGPEMKLYVEMPW